MKNANIVLVFRLVLLVTFGGIGDPARLPPLQWLRVQLLPPVLPEHPAAVVQRIDGRGTALAWAVDVQLLADLAAGATTKGEP
jgi:hypothetical protein